MSEHHVHQCVEQLCQKGCKEVWLDIETLESGQSLPETEGLSSEENEAVLTELKSIMAVYGDTGNCSID